MVRSSFNIQYHRTGVGSIHFLGEINLRQSIQDVFYLFHEIQAVSMTGTYKFRGVLYKQNKSNETIMRLLINTVPTCMPIDEMPSNIWFISTVL